MCCHKADLITPHLLSPPIYFISDCVDQSHNHKACAMKKLMLLGPAGGKEEQRKEKSDMLKHKINAFHIMLLYLWVTCKMVQSCYTVSLLLTIRRIGKMKEYETSRLHDNASAEVLHVLYSLPVLSKLTVISHSLSLLCMSSQGRPPIHCDGTSPPRHSKYSPLMLL